MTKRGWRKHLEDLKTRERRSDWNDEDEQRYVLANPFSGIKVRGISRSAPLPTTHVFADGEWSLLRTVADALEWSYGWGPAAAQRLRFVLDFAYATGLRASELIGATLGAIETDSYGDQWLHLVGKGSTAGKVVRRRWRARRWKATWCSAAYQPRPRSRIRTCA